MEAAKDGISKIGENLNKPVGIAVQIVVGLAVAYVIYLLALLAIKADQLGIDDKFDVNKKQRVPIVDGYADSSQLYKQNFNTIVPYAKNYLPIRSSVNIKGGAQFSYTMWIHAADPDLAVNKCIFLKGDPKRYAYTEKIGDDVSTRNNRVAYCPMFSFAEKPMTFKLQFNTLAKMNEVMMIERIDDESSAMRRNLLSLFSGKWIMVTMVFQDNMPINEFESGLEVKFYVNDVLYQVGRYPTAIKQNKGDLHIFPDDDGAVPKCKISNFAYYNYAITDDEIKRLARSGPNDKPVTTTTKTFVSPMMISDYNRLDIYNT